MRSVLRALVPQGVLKDSAQIKRYLQHVGIDPMPHARAPSRFVQDLFDFDQRIPATSELDRLFTLGKIAERFGGAMFN